MPALDGKVAFVTGAGSGIGRGVALRLARDGADICVADFDLEGAEETAKRVRESGGRAHVERVNVASAEQLERAVAGCVSALGRLDISVANAGIARGGPVLEMSLEAWQDQLDVNLTGVFLTVQATAREMVRKARGGRIVCMSSLAALSVGAMSWAYSATKAGVRIMVRGWAQELGTHGITVNAIGPGIIETPLARTLAGDPGGAVRKNVEERTPVGRVGQPEDIAGLVSYMVGPDGGFMTGSYVLIDGGLRDARGGDDDPQRMAERMRLMQAGVERTARIQALLDED